VTELEESGGPTVLTSSEQAEALLERLSQQILGALLKTPSSSASEIALEVQRSLKTVLYWLKKLLEVGLVQVCGERRRGGRAVRLYAPSSSTGWRFPFTLTSAATVLELIEGQMMPFMREVISHMAVHVREEMWVELFCDERGQVQFNLNARSQRENLRLERTITGMMHQLHLTSEQAEGFNLRLREMLRELQEQPEDASQPTYSVGLFFVPKSVEKA